MSSKKRSRTVIFIIAVGIFAASLSLWRVVSPSHAEGTNVIYLPVVMRDFPTPPTVFGAEAITFTDPDLIDLAVQAKVSWLRIPAFNWSEIEPNAPINGVHTYNWNQVPESSLKNIASNHMYAIATVKMTPSWAQKYPGVYCGPMAQDHLDDFALFLRAAVERYSKPPYSVHHWELGNEPDVDHNLLLDKLSVFGCWGDNNDDYYGGGYYAEMLKVAYPAIKSVDPQAQVLIGGLLLDCDPGDSDCANPKPARFLEGILKNGGGAFFDMVSFHGYPSFNKDIIHDEDYISWNQRGGVVLGKAAFLKEVMGNYGIQKPLFHTEGALLCPDWNEENCIPEPDGVYQDAKADYVVWLYVRALANDFEGSIWYTLDGGGWRSGGLIGDTSDPNSAYFAFQFITEELAEALYLGQPLGTGGDLRAYSFKVPGKTVWVVWSIDDVAHDVTLPVGYTHVYDKLGNPVVVSGGTLAVKSPVYIELP